MPDKLEQFLLLRIRGFQDKAAFEKLVKMHGSAVLRFLHFRLPTKEDAEDAYSIVLLQVWDYIKRTEVKHFNGLLFTVARNVVAAHYEKRNRVTMVPIINEEGKEIQIPSNESPERTINKIDVSFVREKLKELSEDDQEIIILRYLEGYTVKHIAKYLGRTENATSVMLHRAMKKLKDLYERP
jgi:RNA polymerase sigma-70 factor (ECF subfamily)